MGLIMEMGGLDDETIVRMVIVGMVLLAICATLLGVMLGWRLGRTSKGFGRLVDLGEAKWTSMEVRKGRGDDKPLLYTIKASKGRECGAPHPTHLMLCTRPPGHEHDLRHRDHWCKGVYWRVEDKKGREGGSAG